LRFVTTPKEFQGELLLEDDQATDKTRLMTAFDDLNRRYGQGTLQVASAGLSGEQRLWSMKQERRTPAYTTSWADMLVVRA
jgi:DNA polymerase V